MGTPCGVLPVSGWGVWPGVSTCGGTCVPGAVGSPGGRMTGASGSLPSGGLQREQLFSLTGVLLEAVEAENAEQQAKLKGENENG